MMNTQRFFPLTYRRVRGFTLIELMIAIAIVGVLAAIAVPAFANYLGRARVSEAINYLQSCKTGYVEFYSTQGAVPATNVDASCPNLVSTNVASVTINNNPPTIRATLTANAVLPAAIRNHQIILQPLDSANGIIDAGNNIVNWRCIVITGGGAAPTADALNLVPAICKNNAVVTAGGVAVNVP